MNIAIVGSNGFIGKHLVDHLSENQDNNLFLFGRNEASLYKTDFKYTQIDLNNSNQILKSFKNIDIVFYLASASIPASSWENPKSEIENNLIPFINFLECIVQLNVKKIVFTSSAGTIYGTSTEKLTEESDKKPFSPYGINKVAMEYYLNYFESKFNLRHDIFRVSNIYGEGQDTSKGLGIINTFLENIISKQEITVFGNGEIIRNYIYVKDVAKALANSCLSEFKKSNIYNLSSDDSLSINEVIEKIKEITTEEFKINYKDSRESDNPKILLDNTKLKSNFKTLSFTPISAGIKNTYLNLKNEVEVKIE